MLGDPVLDERSKGLSLTHNLISVCSRGDIGPVIVDLVTLSTTHLEVLRQGSGRCAYAVGESFECHHVVAPGAGIESIASARERHLGQEQGGSICRGEPGIVRDRR